MLCLCPSGGNLSNGMRTIWLHTDSGKDGGRFLIDSETRRPPVAAEGVALRVRLGSFSFDQPRDLSGCDRLNLSIHRSPYVQDGLALVSEDVPASSVTSLVSLSAFNNRLASNATWEISAPSMFFALGGGSEAELTMVVTSIEGNNRTVIGSGSLTVYAEHEADRASVGPRGDWALEVEYFQRDLARSTATGHVYISRIRHTSSPDTQPGIGEHWEDCWMLFVAASGEMMSIPSARLMGRVGAGEGPLSPLTASQVRSLLNVENGATADMTAAEIKAAYEVNGDTNAFTDAEREKLAGLANYTLPLPTAAHLGGVKRNPGGVGQFVTGIDAAGNLTYSTPVGADGALSDLDAIGTDEIEDGAVTPAKLAGGPPLGIVGANRSYGTDAEGNLGFHESDFAIGGSTGPERSLLVRGDDGVYAKTGTGADAAAAGNDGRFPTVTQKQALVGSVGTPSSENKYLTERWAEEWIEEREIDVDDLNSVEPDTEPGLVSAAALRDAFLRPNDIDPIRVSIESLSDQMATKLDSMDFAEHFSDGTLFDGDKLDVDYPPEHYAPRSTGNPHAEDSGDLAAHLAGIDDKLGEFAGLITDIPLPEDFDFTPESYTAASNTVAGHLAGIDSSLGPRLTASTIVDPAKFHADKLHIHWEPTNYTPDSTGIAEADDNSDLTAHLVGIDAALAGGGGSGGLIPLTATIYDRDELWPSTEPGPAFVARIPFDCRLVHVQVAATNLDFSVATSLPYRIYRANASILSASPDPYGTKYLGTGGGGPFSPGYLHKVHGTGDFNSASFAGGGVPFRLEAGDLMRVVAWQPPGGGYGDDYGDVKGLQVTLYVQKL